MARSKRSRPGGQRQTPKKPKRRTLFYAYPSRPADPGETILLAIETLRSHEALQGTGLRFRPWPDLPISGQHLLQSITDQIDRSTAVALDVTYRNPNVAFELG